MVRKTQFPRLVIPLAVVLTALFNLGVNLVVVLGFLLAYGVAPAWTWLRLPLIARRAGRAHGRGVDVRSPRSTRASATRGSSGASR